MSPASVPAPAHGTIADGFGPLARRFAAHLADGDELGASVVVYWRGRLVAKLWGGLADVASGRAWQHDTRIVVFSVTKGLVAMALNLASERGLFEWDAPVASYWPEFARAGKERVTVRALFNHRAGLAGLDAPLSLRDCLEPAATERVRRALEEQKPAWEPDSDQGYHAQSFGLYAAELFRRVAGEELNTFLHRELLEPVGSDARLGTPASDDARIATLYPPPTGLRIARMFGSLLAGNSNEARVMRAALTSGSVGRRAFLNPRAGPRGLLAYNEPPVRRAALLWASATASADGVARAYLPLSLGGGLDGRRYYRPETLAALHRRQSWSEQDRVLQKPLGWSQGFLKEEEDVFAPNPESFGHAGMGGALGFCDPVRELAFGYVMNRMDWRVRSPRVKALCRALYACPALLERGA